MTIWWTRETTALGRDVIQQGGIFVLVPSIAAHLVTVDTDVLQPVIVGPVAGHQVARVLLLPSRRARAGGGHHEGGSLGRPTHGANSVVIVVSVVVLILRAVQK